MVMPRFLVGGLAAASALLLVAAGTFVWRTHSGEATALAGAIAKPPPPQPHWTPETLHQLLAAVDASRAEGLRPQDYRRDALAAELQDRSPDIATLATASAHDLAHDYADGRITHRARFDWHIQHSPGPLATLDVDIANAVNAGRLTEYLHGLLPQDARYAALRDALDETPEPARRDAIRASMERWRWMPRALGTDYIWVNVPTYRLALYRGATVTATHDVVVGAPKTPTPMLSANVGSIIVNPWWTLPPTVLHEGAGRRYSSARGYVYQTIHGKTYIRQKPGPLNALGRMKIDMPNAWAIYLHDTPSKGGFLQTDRALSHGCIRVKNITTLASELYDPAVIDGALQTYRMKTLPVKASVPVYIVYFTAAPDADGKVVTYGDPYARDAGLIAALDRQPKPISKPVTATVASITVNRATPALKRL